MATVKFVVELEISNTFPIRDELATLEMTVPNKGAVIKLEGFDQLSFVVTHLTFGVDENRNDVIIVFVKLAPSEKLDMS